MLSSAKDGRKSVLASCRRQSPLQLGPIGGLMVRRQLAHVRTAGEEVVDIVPTPPPPSARIWTFRTYR
jgi:hypothetical protein